MLKNWIWIPIIISKVERGGRQLKRTNPINSRNTSTDKKELLMLWLADQVHGVIQGEPMADEGLKSVSKKLKKAK